MTKTFSNRSNAVRGFMAANADTALSAANARTLVQEVQPGRFAVVVPAPTPVVAEPVVIESSLKGVPFVRASLVEKPVARAHALFADYAAEAGEDMSRKGAVAYAVANGIAFYTARTQYQRWSKSFG